jgi:hypothetical protein
VLKLHEEKRSRRFLAVGAVVGLAPGLRAGHLAGRAGSMGAVGRGWRGRSASSAARAGALGSGRRGRGRHRAHGRGRVGPLRVGRAAFQALAGRQGARDRPLAGARSGVALEARLGLLGTGKRVRREREGEVGGVQGCGG